MADRAYLSIGEVLDLLQEEFPDITISKIRFLESQGLLDPERTPSGYRKFYDDDIERLRWILRQQRENFLPLKVIKGRLAVAVRARRAPARRQRCRPARRRLVASERSPRRPSHPGRPRRREPPTATRPRRATRTASSLLDVPTTSVSMALEELATRPASPRAIAELERYGLLVEPRAVGGT